MKLIAMNIDDIMNTIGITEKRAFIESEISDNATMDTSIPVPNVEHINIPTSIFTVCSRSSTASLQGIKGYTFLTPVDLHATAVVPDPIKGSSTTSPSFDELIIRFLMMFRGFTVGCPYLSLSSVFSEDT